MDKFSIEGKIKDSLKNHEEAVDNEALFTALGISDKKKKRRIFLVIFFMLGAMGVAFVSFSLWAEAPKEVKYISNTDIEPNFSETLEILDNIVEHDEQITIPNQYNNNEDINVETKKLNGKEILKKQPDNYSKNELAIENEINQLDQEAQLMTNSNNDLEDSKFNQNISFEAISTDSIIDITFNTSEKMEEVRDVERISTFHLESKLVEVLVEKNSDLDFIATPQVDSTLNENKSIWSIIPYFGYDQFKRSLVAKNSAFQELENLRSTSEHALENISLGLLIERTLTKSFSASMGFEYSQYNSRFDYNEYIYTTISDSGVIRVDINYVGDSTMIGGSVLAEEYTKRNWKVYNQLSMINLPINLRYQIPYKNVTFFGEAGVTIGLFIQFKGEIYNEDFEIEAPQNTYKIAPNLMYNLGLGSSYRLNKNSSIQAKIRYGQSVSSFTTNTYGLNENYKQIGLQLAYKYRLN